MIKNKNATIYIYVLILIWMVLAVSFIVLNNSISLQNALTYQKTKSKNYAEKQVNEEIKKVKDKNSSLDWSWFIDEISCPDNLTMSWNLSTQSGIRLTWAYDWSSYVCSWSYNWSILNLYLNPLSTSYSWAKWWDQTINLVSDSSWNLNWISRFTIDNTHIKIPADSYIKPDLIDDDYRSEP